MGEVAMSKWWTVVLVAYLAGVVLEGSQFIRYFNQLVASTEKKLQESMISIDQETMHSTARMVVTISVFLSSLMWPYSLLTGQLFDEKDID